MDWEDAGKLSPMSWYLNHFAVDDFGNTVSFISDDSLFKVRERLYASLRYYFMESAYV